MIRLVLILVVLAGGTLARERVSEPAVFEPESAPFESTVDGRAPVHRAAEPDTFVLYGGSGTLEGKFEDAQGNPLFGDWVPRDFTEGEVHWHVSAFGAETLGGQGPGNHAMWCGVESGTGWVAAPGYGNDWFDILEYRSDSVVDPGVGQTVELDFSFHYDVEPGYDHFTVEYDSAGTWITVLSVTGAAVASGVSFADVQARPIVYQGSDYGDEDRIRIRLVFRSDSIYSDEDGDWDTDGAVRVDDVALVTRAGSFTEDFEGTGPYLFEPVRPPFFGDFAQAYADLADEDPCQDDASGVVAFIDVGQDVRNGPSADGRWSTGGSTSQQFTYGLGGFVVNHTGGLDGAPNDVIDNAVISPVIDLSLAEPHDSDPEMAGYRLRFDVYRHKVDPVAMTWTIRLRAGSDPSDLGPWQLFFGTPSVADWLRVDFALEDYLPDVQDPDVRWFQVALGATESTYLGGSIGSDATPAPYFDDVELIRHRYRGPRVEVWGPGSAQDAFPTGPTLAHATPEQRDALDVRFDRAYWNDSHGVAGSDSLIVSARPTVPGTTVEGVTMVWTLRRNPYFEDSIRELPSRPQDRNVTVVGDLWSGEVVATDVYEGSTCCAGQTWSADLPDVDFLHPGDVLHHYFLAVDSDGRVSTLPADLTGFGEFHGPGRFASAYDPAFTVRALPSIGFDAVHGRGNDPPHLLVFDDAGPGEQTRRLLAALEDAGYRPGLDVDVYTMQAPGRSESRRFANAVGTPVLEHLSVYDTILLTRAWPSHFPGFTEDRLALEAWRDLPGDRTTVWFSANVAWYFANEYALGDWFGASLGDYGLLAALGASAVPSFVPAAGAAAAASGRIEGLCPTRRDAYVLGELDGIVEHRFLDADGLPAVPASIRKEVVDTSGDREANLIFPFPIDRLRDGAGVPDATLAGAVIADALRLVGTYQGGSPTAAPVGPRGLAVDVAPNPFNPSTTIRLSMPSAGEVAVRVFDVRGTLVRTVHSGVLTSGTHVLRWDGRDERDHAVGAGVYFVRADGAGATTTRKIALVK